MDINKIPSCDVIQSIYRKHVNINPLIEKSVRQKAAKPAASDKYVSPP